MNAITEPLQHDRSKFIGGSDAAAILGVSPWNTPVELWMQKTGRTPKEEIDPVRQKMFDRGQKLEPFIRDMVIDKLIDLGMQVELVACNERYCDLDHQFMSCEIDFELRLTGVIEIGGQLVQFNDEIVNADAKSVTGFARKKWGDENTEDVPIEYAAQFMHGLMVTPGRRRFCLVAALRSFDDVDIYWTRRDDEVIDAMRAKEIIFWNEHVLADVAPDTLTFDDVKALFPHDNGLSVEATAEIAIKVRELASVKAQIKALEEGEEVLKQQIADFISPHAILTFDNREIATWKGQGRTDFQEKLFKADHPELAAQYLKTSTIRVLRLKKEK
jgi:predicted phage-related endonuclease